MAPKNVNYIGLEFNHPKYGKYSVIEDLGMIHKSNNGRISRLLRIKFDNTGYTVDIPPSMLESVKDPYYRDIAGIGYFGEPKNYNPNDPKDKSTRALWANTINKCYNPNYPQYHLYGAIGITVAPEWHCFANFLEDLRKMENYDRLVDGSKTYTLSLNKEMYKLSTTLANQQVFSYNTCIITPRKGPNSTYVNTRIDSNTPHKVKDISYLIGQRYTNNTYGEYEIIDAFREEFNSKSRIMCTVKFLEDGYEKTVHKKDAIAGSVKNEYKPVIHGVACSGCPDKYGANNNPNYGNRIAPIWRSMISRCYNIKDPDYFRYGAKGVRVCDRWLCLENFYVDFINMPRYDEWVNGGLELDKDYLQQDVPIGQRIYSPSTCVLIPHNHNMNIANINRKTALNQSCPEYLGVRKVDSGNYAVGLQDGDRTIFRELTFTDPYWAAVFRDYAAVANYMEPMNNVPIDDASYQEALKHRSCKDSYKQLYRLIDKDNDDANN